MWVQLILAVVVPLLKYFLEKLFEKWGSRTDITEHKEEYMAQVEKKKLLGKKRMEVASALFDEAAIAHKTFKKVSTVSLSTDSEYADLIAGTAKIRVAKKLV